MPVGTDFHEDLRSTLHAFREAVIDLMAAIGADATKPQDMARSLGLNKNLTWKISKIVTETDLFSAVPRMPGTAATKIFLNALEKAGAPARLIAAARDAACAFDRMVEVHTGDRATLEIMVQQLLPSEVQLEKEENNRKLAFLGHSGLWGVRTRLQLMMGILGPNAARPETADLVQVSGLVAFRRLRPDARWLLARRERWDDDDPHPDRDVVESLDPDFPIGDGVPLMGEFCSKPIPSIDVLAGDGEDQYELPPGPVGNLAAFTCIYGQVARSVGDAVAAEPGEYAEVGCNLITPAKHLLFDLFVHRDFDWAMRPEVMMYSRLDGGALQTTARCDRNMMPVSEPVHDLGWGMAAVATPLLANYRKLVSTVYERLGWNPDNFRMFRFTMSYPPIPTAVLTRAELPVRA